MKKKLKHINYLIIAFFSSFLLDIITKELVTLKMGINQSIPIFDNIFKLTYIKNTGIAFGMFQNFSNILLVVSILVFGFVIYFIITNKFQKKIVNVAFGMILGGATGNIFDRIRFNAVRDFLDFGINSNLRWPIFNIADSVVLIGVFLILIFYNENKDMEGY